MYLIFCLNRQDILPYEDVAFLQGYRWAYKTDDCSPSSIQKRCKKWKPYSSIASRYMYRALDTGLTKMEFHLYK
nr:MAG TPA: 3-methyladenine DNA glycosylase [Caudoviricetes sp.]